MLVEILSSRRMLFLKGCRCWSSSTLKLIWNSATCGILHRPSTLLVPRGTFDVPLSNDFHSWSSFVINEALSLRSSPVEQQRFLFTSLELMKKRKGSYKKTTVSDDLDDEDETEEDILFSDKKNTKEFNASSTRLDMILKSGLGYSRKFIDEAFYESRVMLNGKKAMKKSEIMQIGDEADIVHSYHPDNPNWLLVSRIELHSVSPVDDDNPEEGIRIKLFRHKNIKVENYNPPWRSSSGS